MNAKSNLHTISERELEIIQLLVEELSNKEIAERLFLAPNTVKWYIRQINSKLYTSNRQEIVRHAYQFGLITPNITTFNNPRHNLTRATTPFIGRDLEIEAINQRLADPETRLLTIMGPGGVGKTRIALEVAEQQLTNFSDGVFLVDLTALDMPEQIISVVGNAIDIQFTSQKIGFSTANRNTGLDEQKTELLNHLATKKYLLVFDNFEHLLDGVDITIEILDHAPNIKIIATSRERLHLIAETVYELKGMSISHNEENGGIVESDAVALFNRIAQNSRTSFQIREDDIQTMQTICEQTGGLPLALILAATWVDTLSLTEISNEIQYNIDFLTVDLKDIPARHHSMIAVFDRTWERLNNHQQSTLQRMSIFRSSISREAVCTITGCDTRILQSLINRSLVQKTKNDRYMVHELLRQYSYSKLEQANEVRDVRNKHIAYFSEKSIDWGERVKGSGVIEALNEMATEFDNIRLAWLWSAEYQNLVALEHMWFPLFWFCDLRGRNEEANNLHAEALRQLSPLPNSEPHLMWACLLVNFRRFDVHQDPNWHETYLHDIAIALEIAQQHDDLPLQIHCYRELANVALSTNDRQQALEMVTIAVQMTRENEDPFELAISLRLLAFCHLLNGELVPYRKSNYEGYQLSIYTGNMIYESYFAHYIAWDVVMYGDYKQAEALIQKYQKIQLSFNSYIGNMDSLWSLGWFALFQGQIDKAEHLLNEAIDLVHLHNDTTDNAPFSLLCLSFVKVVREQYDEALELVERAKSYNNPNPLVYNTEIRARSRIAVGQEKYATGCDHLLTTLKAPGRPEALWAFESLCVAMILLAKHDESVLSAEILGLVFTHPHSPSGWMKEWPLVSETHNHLVLELGDKLFEEAWERGTQENVFELVDKVILIIESLDVNDV